LQISVQPVKNFTPSFQSVKHSLTFVLIEFGVAVKRTEDENNGYFKPDKGLQSDCLFITFEN